jgi:hypothetical protein
MWACAFLTKADVTPCSIVQSASSEAGEKMERRTRRQTAWTPPIENIPLRLNVGGVEVVGTIVRLLPNDLDVRIDDGTGRVKALHAPYFQMEYGNRNPDRWHYARADESGTRSITTHGRQTANRLLAALYREERSA